MRSKLFGVGFFAFSTLAYIDHSFKKPAFTSNLKYPSIYDNQVFKKSNKQVRSQGSVFKRAQCQGKSSQNKANMNGEIVLVTGGAGFLGQHIVKMLHEKGENIKEIRVFDMKPFKNALDYKPTKPTKSTVGDLTNLEDVCEAFKGVDAVIHTAGLVSFGTFPDYEGMERVNVQGTKNVIQSCIENDVSRLVYTSTIDVVIGFDEIYNGDESLPIPKKFLFPGYPDTKYRAESMVVNANGTPLNNDKSKCLHTLAVRPNVMYGEGDPFFITNGLKAAKKNNGVLPKIGNGEAIFQQAYVGNMAWAHVAAVNALKGDPSVSGQVYFITDDTPLCNSAQFMETFLKARGYSLSSYSIPYPLVYCLLFATESVLKMVSPVYRYNLTTPLCSIMYINMTLYFNRRKAEEKLKYTPLYSPKEAIEKSMGYYLGIDL